MILWQVILGLVLLAPFGAVLILLYIGGWIEATIGTTWRDEMRFAWWAVHVLALFVGGLALLLNGLGVE
ncbi:hypothetical protein SEA_DARDANUS_69 [Gordonia phage Dardanus]|uniref:Uncharacterized protein n=1 Tax=Gordonia phage Dardanus TaxID=2588489 RepID=A0A514CX57_9CAUD|nr:hypothetical protein KDJ58_gp69 [Gordonia phage Dardanus]QDH85106.1 hypothetical protein SEA_DARDANUS_69 [Gordonia phage Dardanus]